MSRIIKVGEDGIMEVRLYMKISRRDYPELVSLLDGQSRRDQNRIVKSLVFRGALAGTKQIPIDIPAMRSRIAPNPAPPAELEELGPADWLTEDEMAKAFEFAMGSSTIAHS